MLEVPRTTTSPTVGEAPAARPPVDINGRKLSRKLRRISVSHRALMARDAETGALLLHHLPRQKSAAIFEVSSSYIATVAKLTPEERKQVEARKVSLSAIHNRKRVPTDADLDRYIAKAGADRVMAALDRYTAPRFAFAAE